MVSPNSTAASDLPAVDDRLAVPGTRYEVMDGERVYVPPADELHGENHADLSTLLRMHVIAEYAVAVDMLTRTSKTDDIAPDASVYPRARDPQTGGRQLEQLAFEVASSQSLGRAAHKANKLIGRGVRRCFAIDVRRARVLEWSREHARWDALAQGSAIDDPVFAIPVPVAALVDAAQVPTAVARALIAQRHPVIEDERLAARAEGRVDGFQRSILDVLAARELDPTERQRAIILAQHDPDRLRRWLGRAVRCATIEELLALE
jgi:Uma2 family endonuclease